MISRIAILAIAAVAFLIGGVPASAEPNNASSIKTLDTDNEWYGRRRGSEEGGVRAL